MPKRSARGGKKYSLASLTDSLGFLTRVVQVQINDRVRASGGLRISPARLSVLRLVAANPGIRQVDVARFLMVQESNMANLVKDLIAQALIKRQGNKRGGLWVTGDGRRQVEQLTAAPTIDRSYAAVLSDKEYRQLVRLLNRVYRASLVRGPPA